MRSKKSAETFA